MPISRLVKYGLLSSAILIGSTVAVQAQSDLPGCADDVVKDTVLDIIVENIQDAIKGQTLAWQHNTGNDWELDSLTLSNIALQDIHETTGKLTCSASLEGRRDKEIFNRIPEHYKWGEKHLQQTGHWDWQRISYFHYEIYESAEDPEYFIVNVIY